MKKIIFIVFNLVGAVGVCNSQNGDVMKCLQTLGQHTEDYGLEVPNRATFLYMFKEGFGLGKYSEDIRTGALLIERNSVRVCKFFWGLNEPTSFVVKDGAGKIRYNYEHGKKTPFREIGYWKGLNAEKPACNVVSDTTDAKSMVKKIVLAAVKKDMQAKGDQPYTLPEGCRNAGITERELTALNSQLRGSTVEDFTRAKSPSTQQAPSSSQGVDVEF